MSVGANYLSTISIVDQSNNAYDILWKNSRERSVVITNPGDRRGPSGSPYTNLAIKIDNVTNPKSSEYNKFLYLNKNVPSVSILFYEGFNMVKQTDVSYQFAKWPEAVSVYMPTTSSLPLTITPMQGAWEASEFQRLKITVSLASINASPTISSQMEVLEIIFDHTNLADVFLDHCHYLKTTGVKFGVCNLVTRTFDN